MTRHKHADMIIEWANDTSKELQSKIVTDDEWYDVEGCPGWYDHCIYRFKPEVKEVEV